MREVNKGWADKYGRTLNFGMDPKMHKAGGRNIIHCQDEECKDEECIELEDCVCVCVLA